MKTAIFLGAGASAADGAPLQRDIFREYFEFAERNPQHAAGQEMQAQLTDFFGAFFNLAFPVAAKKVSFPTFEEALGILDLAELRREGFKRYELEDFGSYGNRIRQIRQHMVLAMATIIDAKLKPSETEIIPAPTVHDNLVTNLQNASLLEDCIFVSTNYDILVDNALSSRFDPNPGERIDYGVEFTNFDQIGGWSRPAQGAIPLFKLHGSLNWLYCPICNSLTLTPFQKSVFLLTTDAAEKCKTCNSIMNPIIVPPTFYKDMSRVFLALIWNKTENALRKVNQIVFCGYSFPDADMHIKYLLKRVQVNRDPRMPPLKFIVINNNKQNNSRWQEEESRYQRFLGEGNVNYKDLNFETFCQSPQDVLLGSGEDLR